MARDEKAINIFERMPIAQALFTMAVPSVVGQLIILIYSIADTFFIGQTNNPSMVAAVSLLLPVCNLTIPLANMTGIGGGTLISMLIAKNDGDEAKKVCVTSFYICLLIAIIYSIVFVIFNTNILRLLGADADTFIYARNYAFFVIMLGAIPISLTNTMANLLRSCGFSKEAAFGITLGGVLNIFLDPLFMFVIFKKGYEVEGAAIATLLSNVISMFYFFIVSHKVKKVSSICYDIKLGFAKFENVLKIFYIGMPGCATSLCFDIDYMVLDRLMASYGAIKLAALGIVLKVERLPLNTGVGICLGMAPIVAYNKSANNQKRLISIVRLALLSGLTVAMFSVVIYSLFAPQIISFFINDMETISAGTVFLRYRCLASGFMFTCFFFAYFFQSLGEGTYSMLLGLVRWLCFNIPFLFIFNHIFGMNGLVMAQVAADVIMACASLIIYFRYKKKALVSGKYC